MKKKQRRQSSLKVKTSKSETYKRNDLNLIFREAVKVLSPRLEGNELVEVGVGEELRPSTGIDLKERLKVGGVGLKASVQKPLQHLDQQSCSFIL